jgi:hypothetical protein
VRFLVVEGSCALAHALVDQDSFLPCATQRYHQLFMPALQLVAAMLASLGTKHTTANHQVGHECYDWFVCVVLIRLLRPSSFCPATETRS